MLPELKCPRQKLMKCLQQFARANDAPDRNSCRNSPRKLSECLQNFQNESTRQKSHEMPAKKTHPNQGTTQNLRQCFHKQQFLHLTETRHRLDVLDFQWFGKGSQECLQMLGNRETRLPKLNPLLEAGPRSSMHDPGFRSNTQDLLKKCLTFSEISKQHPGFVEKMSNIQ